MVFKNLKFRKWPLAPKNFNGKLNFLIFSGIFFSFASLSLSLINIIYAQKTPTAKVLGESTVKKIENTRKITTVKISRASVNVSPTFTPAPTKNPPTPTKTAVKKATSNPTNTPTPTEKPTSGKNYTAEKIGDSTYKITHTSSDAQMASAQDIYNALNSYRGAHGKANLSWDDSLANFARERVNTYASIGNLDSHAGFRSFMDNDGFAKIGFNGLGENSAKIAGNMTGERIVKEIFGADAEHDGNQLDNWTHVGVGVNGYYINVNFGKNKR